MSEQLTLSAETRERAGKGASRVLRREGRVPAVVYGNNEEPLSIHVEEKALIKALSGGHFMNSVVMIEAGGAPVRTLPKDVQFHPVTDRPLHVDFLRISEHAKVTVAVPIRFVDEDKSQGIKRGGVLNTVRHELELVCDAAEIPEEIVISLAGMDIGDSLHISRGHPAQGHRIARSPTATSPSPPSSPRPASRSRPPRPPRPPKAPRRRPRTRCRPSARKAKPRAARRGEE